MKKLILSACMCLMGLSAQAMRYDQSLRHSHRGYEDSGLPTWQGLDYKSDWDAARACLNYYSTTADVAIYYTIDNLKLAMERFGGEFLTWKFGAHDQTIVHRIALRGSSHTLRYVLGFFSSIDHLKDNQGRTPYDIENEGGIANKNVLEEYRQQHWEHPEEILELRNKPAASTDSFLSTIFNKKVVGILASLVALGLFYRYKSKKDNKPPASAK